MSKKPEDGAHQLRVQFLEFRNYATHTVRQARYSTNSEIPIIFEALVLKIAETPKY